MKGTWIVNLLIRVPGNDGQPLTDEEFSRLKVDIEMVHKTLEMLNRAYRTETGRDWVFQLKMGE